MKINQSDRRLCDRLAAAPMQCLTGRVYREDVVKVNCATSRMRTPCITLVVMIVLSLAWKM